MEDEAEIRELLARVDGVLDRAHEKQDDFQRKLDELDRTIDEVERFLTAAERSMEPQAAGEACRPAISRFFAAQAAAITEVNEKLDVSLDPGAATESFEGVVNNSLARVETLAQERAAEIVGVSEALTQLFASEVIAKLHTSTEEWSDAFGATSDELEAFSETFTQNLEGANDKLESTLQQALEEALGEKLSDTADNLASVFDALEEVLGRAEDSIGEGAENIVEAIEPVLEVQEKISDLRPLLEILL